MFQFDDAFIQQLLNKNPQTYNEFYQRTVDVLYRYAHARYFLSKAEADDLLSDFYLKFWQVMHKYDPQYNFGTFVWTVYKNMLKDYFKKSKQYHINEEMLAQEEDVHEDALIEIMERSFQLQHIEWAMQRLDEQSYEIIFLKFVEWKTAAQMWTILRISQEAVRQRLSRALRKLKDLLEE